MGQHPIKTKGHLKRISQNCMAHVVWKTLHFARRSAAAAWDWAQSFFFVSNFKQPDLIITSHPRATGFDLEFMIYDWNCSDSWSGIMLFILKSLVALPEFVSDFCCIMGTKWRCPVFWTFFSFVYHLIHCSTRIRQSSGSSCQKRQCWIQCKCSHINHISITSSSLHVHLLHYTACLGLNLLL